MLKRTLGRTGLEVSIVGFGGIPIQRIAREEAETLVVEACNNGINFIDTARGYSVSEDYIGTALENNNLRSMVILATKSPARDYETMKKEVETSLKMLRTNFIDLYQFHNVRNIEQLETIMGENGAYRALEEAKAEVRGEVRDRISVVRDEMLTLPISSRATASVNLLGAVPYPPPDDKLGELALHYASLLDKYRQDFGLVGAAADLASVSDDAVYAFKERFSIEREVRRLWNTRAVRGDFVRYPGLSRMLDDLTMYEVVPPPLV